ncbi:MAG: PEGA domain-containing protein [Myxococcales bacterium]|nr:PEGA domain-containing protein [Myxococcales bacterium]
MNRSWIAFGAISVVLVHAPATAQRRNTPDPQAQQRETARQAYARGQQRFREGAYADAEAAFLEAYAAVPNPVVLLGVAEARERQGNVRGAAEALERYLAERADAPDRATVTERLERLRRTPAKVFVRSRPPGAWVHLDGTATGSVTPTELEVAPGSHTVRLQLDGYDAWEQTFEVGFAERREIEAALVEAPPPAPSEEDVFGTETQQPPAAPAPAADSPSEGPGAAVWIAGGLAGAGLVGGTVLGFLALGEQAEFDEMPSEETADRGERLALFADVCFGVAAVSALTALVLYATGGGGDSESSGASTARGPHLSPVLVHGGAGLLATGRY